MPTASLRPSVTALNLTTPSSISRDLRTPSPRLSAVRDQSFNSSTGNVSHLLLPTADGELTKICGSLVEPEEKRQRWACVGCKAVFARDATIYLPPASTSTSASLPKDTSRNPLHDAASSSLNRRLAATTAVSQEPYCKACYAERFALGDCLACQKPVLGTTKEEGKFVKSSTTGAIWHGRCFKCTACGASGETSGVCIGMDGLPTCADCFDRPRPRTNVASIPASANGFPRRPPSPLKQSTTRRVTPPASSSFSANATRQPGMGATIAELSRKFGHAPPASAVAAPSSPKRSSPIIPQHSGRQSPIKGSLSRSNSIVSGARPLTAQFSGQGFNLAAFQPSTPTLGRSDSRSRCASPTKEMHELEDVCSKCFKGPFDGPEGSTTKEARMIVIQSSNGSGAGGSVCYHAKCFCCAICHQTLENATRSFVRLDQDSFAHPACAPPATIVRQTTRSLSPARPASLASSSSSSTDFDHPTHQRLPRPTLDGEKPQHTLPTSYLMGHDSMDKRAEEQRQAPTKMPTRPHAAEERRGSLSTATTSSTTANRSNASSGAMPQNSLRRFQPTSGAAPPTRSTLLHSGRSSACNTQAESAHRIASLAVSSHPSAAAVGVPGRLAKLGGMQLCGGCNVAVSALEGVPGPRGQTWHRKCLVCSANPTSHDAKSISLSHTLSQKRCGKQLDSSAKVTAEGQLRCRECYDRERARHRIGV